ncbi:L-ribulose-5-phosphate 3-epimerase [uncultured Sphaerochaeta sp.]|uniref:L-ribulose-5-phosphate 3-epimerase n=1 Tax=uncultured Sphaerochaeta sp. TaxID=886478 RepID=UPI002A0A11EC|nr:L-ribulose-5-phosphate 3-epimerase [uncultured Sphaerochaeta sp.]
MRHYLIGLYEKAMPSELSWTEKFVEAKNAGFDYVEISIDETEAKLARLDWNEKEILSVVEAGRKIGMKIGSMCLSGHRKYPLGGPNSRNLEIMQKAIDFASIAGIPIIQIAGYDVYYEPSTEDTRKEFEQNLELSAKMAAKEGILLGFETMETPFMDTVEKSMHYVNTISSPFLQVYPDLGNLTNASLLYGKSVVEDLSTGEGHILAAHIKETVPGKYREIPFGTGQVDFKTLLAKTWNMKVRRYVTELWYTGNSDWRDQITNAATLARNILDKLDREQERGKEYAQDN